MADIEEWEIGPVASRIRDTIHYDRDVVGLYSNAAEWTSTWGVFYPKFASATLPFAPHDIRILRGGLLAGVTNRQFIQNGGPEKPDPRPLWDKGPWMRETVPVFAIFPELGFRCARSRNPRLQQGDFVSVISE